MRAKEKATAALMDEWRVKGKPVGASASEMAEVVLPAQTNVLGKLLGGHVMHMVDIVAAMAASRHANSYMVTSVFGKPADRRAQADDHRVCNLCRD